MNIHDWWRYSISCRKALAKRHQCYRLCIVKCIKKHHVLMQWMTDRYHYRHSNIKILISFSLRLFNLLLLLSRHKSKNISTLNSFFLLLKLPMWFIDLRHINHLINAWIFVTNMKWKIKKKSGKIIAVKKLKNSLSKHFWCL